MVFRCRMPVRVAAATSVFVMGLTVIAGASTHALAGRPVWGLLVWSVPGAILGGQIGSHLASRINPDVLKKWLSVLFFAVGAAMIAISRLRTSERRRTKRMSEKNHITLRVEGMTCDGCARHVTEALKNVSGVEEGRCRAGAQDKRP